MNILEALEPLLKDRPLTKSRSGSTVLYQGEAPRNAYVIKSGIVKVFNISAGGNEQVISLDEQGVIFPISWVYDKAPVTVYFYEALSDCELYCVEREELKKFIATRNGVMQIMLDHYVTNYTASQVHISALEQSKAREKIMYILYFLCRRYGKIQKNNLVNINLKLTHQDIANLVGLSRETTSIELSKLKRKGLVNYYRSHYIINISQLLEAIGEESFTNAKLR